MSEKHDDCPVQEDFIKRWNMLQDLFQVGPTALITFRHLQRKTARNPLHSTYRNYKNTSLTVRDEGLHLLWHELSAVGNNTHPPPKNEILVDRFGWMSDLPLLFLYLSLTTGLQTSEEYDLIPSIKSLKPRRDWFPPEYGWPRGKKSRGKRLKNKSERKTAVKKRKRGPNGAKEKDGQWERRRKTESKVFHQKISSRCWECSNSFLFSVFPFPFLLIFKLKNSGI